MAASATRSRARCGRRRKTAASAASTSSAPAASTRCRDCPACCAEARRHEAGIQTFLLSTSGHRRRMSTYNAPLQDIRFALHDVLGAEALFARLGFTEARSEEHTSELQSLMRISYAVFCLKKKNRLQY